MAFRNGSRASTLAMRLGLAAAVGIGLAGCGSQAATSPPAAPSLGSPFAPSVTHTPTTPVPVNLKDLTGTRYFGTAVNDRLLGRDADYTKLLNAQFSQVTPENAMKWGPLEPTPGALNWSAADALVASAQANGQKVRGHTLVWHSQLPSFISDGKLTKAQLNDTLKAHIEAEMGRYKGKIYAWDVVNEAFNDDGTMRQSVFYTTLGRGQHRRRHLLGKITRRLVVHPVGVQLAQVSVCIFIARLRHADRRRNQPMRLVRAQPRRHRKGNLARLRQRLALLARNNLAARRQNARDMHQVAFLDARIPQRQLEAAQLVLVGADPFGEEDLRRNKVHAANFVSGRSKNNKFLAALP